MTSFNQKNLLFNKLDSICDVLRKSMEVNEYKHYILGFIFYKFLSEKLEDKANELLKNDNLKYKDLNNEHNELQELINQNLLDILGYLIDKEHLFSNWVEKVKNNEDILTLVEESFIKTEQSTYGKDSEKDFKNLFNDINLTSSKLGHTESAKNKTISKIVLNLSEIDFKFDDAEIDILGDAYEHLIANFASESGKKAGEFYTPQEVSEILARIVTLNKERIKNAYDPTCGSGSLLLQVSKLSNVGKLYGQEMKQTTYNLARMNMFLRGKGYHDFDIRNEDTLINPQHKYDEKNNIIKFEAIVANPPFSLKWDAPDNLLNDERFIDYGKLAPKKRADYAFVQHMLFHLADNGVMATVVPHGVLFRGASEGIIRKYIIEKKNWLDAIIGLPKNIFYGTDIPTCVLVFKKNRLLDDKILFIEASRGFEKGKNQNKLSEENIFKIIDTYSNKNEIDKYSKLVSLEEIKNNKYNLNITRYIEILEEEEEIDLISINNELKEINLKILETEKEIEEMMKELVETK